MRLPSPRFRVPSYLAALVALTALVLTAPPAAAGCADPADVCDHATRGDMALIDNAWPAAVVADARDFPGVLRAAANLRTDLGAVAGAAGELVTDQTPDARTAIIVGTIGRSALIDDLIRRRKLDVTGVRGQWEAYAVQLVDDPTRHIKHALVIAGADKRGTIFGIYDLSARIGVSPWTWWADVPVRQQIDVRVTAGRRTDAPRVKYRGIFINDEDPSLKGWVDEKFGGFNHQFYEHVFELILRLKGNYLWPAMWGKAIYDDDPQSPELADEMGVVLGTSHHEPMMRAHVEWQRYGEGAPWDYTQSEERLRAFWRRGVERMGDNESLVTVGMRGDGDMPMTQGTAISLLERIVRDQRAIIAEVTGRPASETPQIWALYKEVQDYYDQGMQVPDDVTLLFSDDNWGDIRRLPPPGRARGGGYGIYYHFDYVGGPRNYKWINTNQIERVWEQMHLAREYGADRVWIVNVGDLKPMEFPISFFLDYAWNPEAWPLERLPSYARDWAAQQFGPEHAAEIAEFLTRYTRYNARRKPELLSPDTYSLVNYREAERVVGDYNALAERAEAVGALLPAQDHDAYFQLVLYPIEASANLNALYVAAARNRLYAAQGRASANAEADRVAALFARDAELTAQYHALGAGRWNHMMDQTHIGYTSWQQPARQSPPATRTLNLRAGARMGVAVEGDARAWPGGAGAPALPAFTPFGPQSYQVTLFRRGAAPFAFTATPGAPWLHVSQTSGEVRGDVSLDVSVDWAHAPKGEASAALLVRRQGGEQVSIAARISNPEDAASAQGFIESDGVVAIEAEHYSRAANADNVAWRVIPGLGRTLSGVAAFPRTAPSIEAPGAASPHLEYLVQLWRPGDIDVAVTLAPSLDFLGRGGLRYAVSIDDAPPQIVNVHGPDAERAWNGWVSDNAITSSSRHHVAAAGRHVVKIWLVDPGLVFERVVLARAGRLPQSYLGPPESRFVR
jgi:Glycosyl hydrolase family 115/Gylcosyl hydrolase family 115 C-terminal domain